MTTRPTTDPADHTGQNVPTAGTGHDGHDGHEYPGCTGFPDLAHPGTAALSGALEGQHQRILAIVAGLDDADLRRPVVPTGWSFAGMLRHLGLGAEFWCNHVVTGDPTTPIEEGEDFVVPAGAAADTVAEAAARLARARETIAPLAPDTPVGWFPEGLWGDWRLDTVTEVLLHLLVEATCHAGHLDIARELVDGRTWDYATWSLADPLS